MISQGLTLTILGMVIVFIFLTLLVLVMVILSAVAKRITKDTESTEDKKKTHFEPSGSAEEEIAAAIAVAYSQT